MKNILLASTSTLFNGDYLDYLLPVLKTHFKNCKTILFIPYARPGGISYDDYTKKASDAFKIIDIEIKGLHEFKHPVEAIEKAEEDLFNDEIRLWHLVEPLLNYKMIYKMILKSLTKRETGEHQLLYDLLIPIVDRLKEHELSDYRIRQVMDNLMLVFEYDGEAVGQSVLKYNKKPYFPKRIMSMIDEAGNHPFQPLHQALKKHLDSI